jgi:hypothetical protein
MRAYISVDIGGYRRQNKNIRFEFRPVINNTGNTPANNVRVLSKSDIIYDTISDIFDYRIAFEGTGRGSSTTLSPRQNKFHAHVFNRKCSMNEIRDLLKARNAFHLWGQVTYEDIFGIERYTRFSYMIYIPTNKRGTPVWHTTDKNNEAN